MIRKVRNKHINTGEDLPIAGHVPIPPECPDWVTRRRAYHAELKKRYELKKAKEGIKATY